jgi:hypothetical protein
MRAVDEVRDPVGGNDTVRQMSDVGGQALPDPPLEPGTTSILGSTKQHRTLTRSDRST